MEPRKKIPEAIKRILLKRLHCENIPQKPGVGCDGYICPMWIYNNGNFDDSGREIDHKIERACGGTDDISNLQVLCPCCHSFKTRKYLTNRGIAAEWFDAGVRHMDIDKVLCKNKKPAIKRASVSKTSSVSQRTIENTSRKSISPPDVEMKDDSPVEKRGGKNKN